MLPFNSGAGSLGASRHSYQIPRCDIYRYAHFGPCGRQSATRLRPATGAQRCHASSSAQLRKEEVVGHDRPAGGASTEQTSSSGSQAPSTGGKRLTRKGKTRTCDFTTLAACVSDLRQSWVPAKVDQVVQPDSSTLCLKLRNQAMLEGTFEEKQWLYLSWHQTHARICVGSGPERGSSSEAFSLAEQIQAALRGKVLLDVRLPKQWERNAELEFGPRLGEPSHRLFLEIMGNYSNLVLTDEGGRIVSCARQISSKMSSKRSLQTGAAYSFPPAQSGAQPSASQPLEDWRAAVVASASDRAGSISAALSTAYQGMSPGTATEICWVAGITADAAPAELTDSQWEALHSQWNAWVASIEGSTFRPTVDSNGNYSMVGGLENGTPATALDAVDTYYRMPQEEDGFGRTRQQVASAVKRALGKLEGKRHALLQQLQQAQRAEETQKKADLIMAHLHLYQRGDSSLEVQDWDTGETQVIKLDAATPAKDQAETLYKKARKLRRTTDNVEPLLQQVDEDRDFLTEIESQVEVLDPADKGDAEALQQIQEELVQRKFAKPAPDAALAAKGASKARKAARKAKSAGPNFRRYTSPSGFQVLVGRNNVQNDELTHRVANDSDLWFHARGVPGSHTVLRIPSGREAAEADIQFASDAAAFFSKARNEGKADVVYAFVKGLSKPKGARPGQVLVSSERVVVARPSDCPAAQESTDGSQ